MIAPGIYFGLDEGRYRADPALGSTDKKMLLSDPAAFWWRSGMNPAREPEVDTEAMIKGRAVHHFVLFGAKSFFAAYGRCQHKGNTKLGMTEREAFAAAGAIPLPGKDFDRIVGAAAMIRANPEVATAFTGGYAEVSVFWRTMVDGEEVAEKARFDFLKPRAVADLKSHAPRDGLRFSTSCMSAIKRYGYPLQAASYLGARAMLAQFVADGAVHGDHDADWLKAVAAQDEFAFVLVFWASSGAPLTWGGAFSPQNPKIVEGQRAAEAALLRYVQCRREFGTDRAWITPEPLTEIEPDEVDNWFYRDRAAA